jgi:hypothetical protein
MVATQSPELFSQFGVVVWVVVRLGDVFTVSSDGFWGPDSQLSKFHSPSIYGTSSFSQFLVN